MKLSVTVVGIRSATESAHLPIIQTNALVRYRL